MGKLSYFPLSSFVERFNVKTLIETGAGRGTGIDFMSGVPGIENIFSCEIDEEQARVLIERYKSDKRISVANDMSVSFLAVLLPWIYEQKSVIFWLDSHFPGADLGKAAFDEVKDMAIRLPLENELEIIYQCRNPHFFKDVVLIDDWRIYEKMPFKGGDLHEIGLGHLASYGKNFIDKWSETHMIEKSEIDTGYLSLIPLK